MDISAAAAVPIYCLAVQHLVDVIGRDREGELEVADGVWRPGGDEQQVTCGRDSSERQ